MPSSRHRDSADPTALCTGTEAALHMFGNITNGAASADVVYLDINDLRDACRQVLRLSDGNEPRENAFVECSNVRMTAFGNTDFMVNVSYL